MRRLIAAAAVSGVLLVSGCSSDAETTAGADAAATPAVGASAGAAGVQDAAAAADAALSGNTAAICLQAQKTGGNAASNFAQDLKLLIDAESAKDKAAAEAAKSKTSRDMSNYSSALKDMSAQVSDTTVKKTLADMAASVDALKGDVRKLDEAELGKLQTTLSKACGGN